jgi:GT2 family glycosyltransferase
MSVQPGTGPGGGGAGTPELSFVVVNWNGGELLRRAIESILASPPRVPYGIVVVDNASTNESLGWLRSAELAERLGDVKLALIENPENVGFGRANNQAFASTGARLLFLLNADAELRPGACDTLVATLESDARIGACGPRLVNPDGSLQISVWRNPPAAWSTLLSGLRLYRLLPRRLRGELLLAGHWAHDRRRDVGMLSGAAILVRRELVEAVGGFDERFHMYGEDNEWCLRMVRAGWRLVFEPAAVVMHHGGHSSQRRWTDRERLDVQLDAFFRFQRFCLSRRQAVANLLATSVLLSVHRLWRRLRGQPVDDVTLTLRMHLADLKRTLRPPRSSGASSD